MSKLVETEVFGCSLSPRQGTNELGLLDLHVDKTPSIMPAMWCLGLALRLSCIHMLCTLRAWMVGARECFWPSFSDDEGTEERDGCSPPS